MNSENFSNKPPLTCGADFGIFLRCDQSRLKKNRRCLCALASVCLTHSSSSLYVQTRRCSFCAVTLREKKQKHWMRAYLKEKASVVTRTIKQTKHNFCFNPLIHSSGFPQMLLCVLLMAVMLTMMMVMKGMIMPLVKLGEAHLPPPCSVVQRLLLPLGVQAGP